MTTKTKSKAEEAVQGTAEAVAAGTETVETMVKAGTEAAAKGYETAFTMTKDQMAKASGTVFKGYGEFAALGKANMDAMIEAQTILAQGVQDLGKEVMGFTQASVQNNVEVAKRLFGCTTVSEAVDVQATWARGNLDSFLAESSKLGNMSMTVASKAMEPVQSRVSKAFETLVKPIAA
jgi:hypothetical protein